MQGFRILSSNKNYRQAGSKKVAFMEAMSTFQISMPSRKTLEGEVVATTASEALAVELEGFLEEMLACEFSKYITNTFLNFPTVQFF